MTTIPPAAVPPSGTAGALAPPADPLSPDILSALNDNGGPSAGAGALTPDVLTALNSPPSDVGKSPTAAGKASLDTYGPQSQTMDIVMSILDALPKGAAKLFGAPADLINLATQISDKVGDIDAAKAKVYASAPPTAADHKSFGPTSTEIRSAIEGLSGQPLYEPQTGGGKYAGSTVEGAVSVPFAPVLGAISGLGGEAGEQLAGPWGRFIGALASGGLYSLAKSFLGSAPSRQIGNALRGVSDVQLHEADLLMQQAEAAGTPLTADEAIAQVTGGNTRLTNLRRVVEQSPRGAEAFEGVTGPRAGANEAAMKGPGGALENIGPGTAEPTEIAPKVQAAAAGAVKQARDATNAASQAAYDATANNPAARLSPEAFADLADNPAVVEAIKSARANPIKYGDLRGMADQSAPVLDAAKKYLDDVASSAERAGENYAATNAGGAARAITDALDAEMARYASARNIQSTRQKYVEEPLSRSPIGQLAEAKKFPEQAKIIFETNPLPGSETQIGDAVRTVAEADPAAARIFVRLKLEQAFNEVTQQLSGGANRFGGAGYAATMTGNAQQAKNLRAAIEALPDGQEAGRAFFNLMRIFKAQGTAPRAGSMTAFNEEIQAELSRGGTIGEMFKTATSPGSWLELGKDIGARASYAFNTRRLADILTSPNAIEQMRTLARIGPDSPAGRALFGLLVAGTENAPPSKPPQ